MEEINWRKDPTNELQVSNFFSRNQLLVVMICSKWVFILKPLKKGNITVIVIEKARFLSRKKPRSNRQFRIHSFRIRENLYV